MLHGYGPADSSSIPMDRAGSKAGVVHPIGRGLDTGPNAGNNCDAMPEPVSQVPSSIVSSLRGCVIASERQPDVRYILRHHIGEGGMGIVYYAERVAPEGTSPVVVKAVMPEPGARVVAPELYALKEAVALGRLNERVPPTPFVVRLVDAGSAQFSGSVATPWLAIEYVHGGAEGTTLDDRITYSIHRTGYAFDPVRAAHALRCLSAGLSAIHSVGVIHRDLTPGNVLCCGFGVSEIFKIADFGVARSEGVSRTFGNLAVGTIGYVAPEQGLVAHGAARPATDVFSLACVMYHVLTGRHYFDAHSPYDAHELARDRSRPSIADSPMLSPELQERADACRAIDAGLARATALDPSERPSTAHIFASSVLPWLTDQSSGPRSSRRLMTAVLGDVSAAQADSFVWVVRQRPTEQRVVRSAAWDADGRCFAFTAEGPAFWNGESWLEANDLARQLPPGLTFATRYEAGGWLLGGARGTLAVCSTDGVGEVVQAPDHDVEFSAAVGRLDGMLVAVGTRHGTPVIWTRARGEWIPTPVALTGISSVNSLVRLDDEHWLIAGRSAHGRGFCARYAPLTLEVSYLKVPPTRAFVAASSSPERGVALAVGAEGTALRVEGGVARPIAVRGGADLTAAAVDVVDHEWAASPGTLWSRVSSQSEWAVAWSDPSWKVPFISLMAEMGIIAAMTADGGIVEGHRLARMPDPT